MISKLPKEATSSHGTKIQGILQRKLVDSNNATNTKHNFSIQNLVKTIVKAGLQHANNSKGANMTHKKLIQMRTQGLLKN